MNQFYDWLVQDQIIFTSLIGPLTVDMFPKLDQRMIAMLDASTGKNIHILSDISQMTSMPNIIQMSKLKYPAHPKVGFFLTQQRNPIEKFVGSTVGQMLKSKYKFIDNLDQGIHFLCQVDDTLPPKEEIMHRLHEIQDAFIQNNVDETFRLPG